MRNAGVEECDGWVVASDADLLRESRIRPEAFVVVCRRHADQLLGWLRREVGPDVAEDLLAETVARAWYHRGRFRDPGTGSAGAWLQGIAANLARDYRRHGAIDARARQRLGLVDEREDDPSTAVDERLSAAAEFARVAPAFQSLPEAQRAALRLRVVGELAYNEIGRSLAIAPATARTRVHRALSRLRLHVGSE